MKKKPPPLPFWRNPRNLAVVIGIASAALVAAGAAAIMLNSPGDFATTPHVKRLTPTFSSSSPITSPKTAAVTASETSSETSTFESIESPPSQTAPAPSRSSAPTPSSPRQNPPPPVVLTRNPMSFHPSPIPKP